MKIAALIFLFIAVAYAAEEPCAEGHIYNDGCNTCICSNGLYACTERACYDGPIFADTVPAPQPARKRRDSGCDKGESYEEDCNTCTCHNDQYVCTRRACYHGPTFADTAPAPQPARKRRDSGCDKGESYEEDCNTCTCNNDQYVCTRRACYHGPTFADTAPAPQPARKRRDDVDTVDPACPKGKSYKNDCNTCICMGNGAYACTLIGCYHEPIFPDTVSLPQPSQATLKERREVDVSTGKYDLPKPDPLNTLRFDVARCEPGEVKNQQCNRCKCTRNGKGWLCTRKICPQQA